ncbi:HNH endonuclease [Clostridium botulinum C/D]|nr:HNH endonuclease [Clostridium botulinum C/D]MCD3297610.1 HNH endonuclease [Clostridium botulinum C/D]
MCPKCGKLIDYEKRYCKNCEIKKHEEKLQYEKLYDMNYRDKESDLFYHSKSWRIKREQIKHRDHGLCQVCLMNKSIKNSDMVHHIVELKEDRTKGLEDNNLICLCSSCHATVHGMYSKSSEYKSRTQAKLKELIHR